MRVLLFIVSLVTFFQFSFSQKSYYSIKNKKAIKLYENGVQAFKTRDFDGGFAMLEKACEVEPAFAEAHLELAKNYVVFKNKRAIIYHYEEVVKYHGDNLGFVTVRGKLGDIYLAEGNYDGAIEQFNYLMNFEESSPSLRTKVIPKLDQAIFCKKQVESPLDVNPVMLPKTLNAFQFNSGPFLTADKKTMVFTGRDGFRKGNEDIFESKFVNNQWSNPVSVSDSINTAQNEGYASISGDGRTLVFASSNRKEGKGKADLYISYKLGDNWSAPQNLGAEVNSEKWESEPSISADGRIVYFSSDRVGGKGGRDIWFTTKNENGSWSSPVNLGDSINTNQDEVTPVIHADNHTLLFSSNGWLGMGGFDSFSSIRNVSDWSKAINIGYPLNTNENEGGLNFNSDFTKGYYEKYVFGENGTTPHSEIFEVVLPQALKLNLPCVYAWGKVTDAETGLPLKAKIELIDLENDVLEQRVYSDSIQGDYLVVLRSMGYGLFVEKEGYSIHSVDFSYSNSNESKPVELNVKLHPIKEKEIIALPHVYFETASSTLKNNSFPQLNKVVKMLDENPKMKIEISGHTDNKGENNLLLSKKRAESVVSYLQNKGIDSNRLIAKGYGDSKPKATNDTDKGRQQNRRVEVLVLAK